MLLGCCHCEQIVPIPFEESSASSGPSEGSGISTESGCGWCIGNVQPRRYKITWDYQTTNPNPPPCCEAYTGQNEYIVTLIDPSLLGDPSICTYATDELALREFFLQNCVPIANTQRPFQRKAFLMISPNNVYFPGDYTILVGITWYIRWFTGFTYTLYSLYVGKFDTPFNCVQSFTLWGGDDPEWYPQPIKWQYLSPCGAKIHDGLPDFVTVEPA